MKTRQDGWSQVVNSRRLRVPVVAMFCALCVLAAAGMPFASAPAKQDQKPQGLADLAKRRVQLAEDMYEGLTDEAGRGGTLDEYYEWSRHWLESSLDLPGASGIEAYETHLSRMQEHLERFRLLTTAGRVSYLDVRKVEYYVGEAAFWVERAKGD